MGVVMEAMGWTNDSFKLASELKAMSMFTVVGILGMTGIIINDSIVLVTQIDEYAPDRGMFRAIIDRSESVV